MLAFLSHLGPGSANKSHILIQVFINIPCPGQDIESRAFIF